MTRIRADLGDDAFVLATRQTAAGVSVTAAVAAAVEDDLSSLLLPADDRSASQAVEEALTWHGVPSALRASLLGAASGAGADGALGRLTDLLARVARFAPLKLAPGCRLALIGPHGAGKTATAARLAVDAVMQGCEHRLICADRSRAAAAAQLQALVAPIGSEPVLASDPGELAAQLAAEGRACIIDTAGLNPFRGEELARIAALVQAARAEAVVVMPAGMAAEDMAAMAANFAAIGATRLVVSKLDAARRLGGVVLAAAAGLTLAGATIAPEIGRPVLPLTAAGLARLLLRRQTGSGER